MSRVATEDPSTTSELEVKRPEGAVERCVKGLILHLYKAFSAMRMYAPNHPALHDSLQLLFNSFDQFFDVHHLLRIDLTESEMLFHGQPVYREEEKGQSLIFMLFNDGVREIRFEKGLTREEIEGFLQALKINSGLPQEERDIVSLFWVRDFDHIHYFAVEEIPDQEIESVDRALCELESQESVFDSIQAADEVEERSQSYRTGGPPFDSTILSRLKAYDHEEVEGLLETLSRGRSFDAEAELVSIIFDVLHLEEETDRYLPPLKLLEEYSDELLARCAFGPINRIIRGLRALVENHETGSPQLGRCAEAVLRKFSGEEKMNLLRVGLHGRFSYEPRELRTFVTLLRPTAIGPICSLLNEIGDSKVREAICQGLEILAKGHVSRLARPVETGPERVAKEIVTVLGRIGDEALEILKTCVNHGHKVVRGEAVRALRAIGSPGAQRVLIEFLTDKDSAIRVAAAEGLEAFDRHCDIEPLLGIVQRRTFNLRSFREKRALLSVLGRAGSKESTQILEALLNKRGVLHRRRYDETRACAALALGLVNSDTAHRLLERFCHHSSPVVRRACIQALHTARTQHRRQEPHPGNGRGEILPDGF